MKFISTHDSNEGLLEMASRIAGALNADRPVLWLICGGSNIPGAVEALYSIHAGSSADSRKLLTVAQTDERYGPVGHHDSNWHQMKVAGFDFSSVKTMPILIDRPLEETVEAYSRAIELALDAARSSGGLIVALFGIGPDGHIAGMIPHSPAVSSAKMVCGYDAGIFTRVTLTPPALKRIEMAYAFAFGESKKEALVNLRDKELSIDDEPAVILKGLKEAFVYSDQV